MKNILTTLLLIAIWSCSNNTNTSKNSDTANATYNEEKPDTTVHPNGLNNSSVTSTDTAAYRVPDSSQ